MLINYTYEKDIKVFTLRLSKALLCPKRKEALQQLLLRMESWKITSAFNPEKTVQYFALVFKRLTSSCNRTGNRNSQTTNFACINLCKKHLSKRCTRGTSKTPVFGILCRGGKVWAQVVDDVEAKTLLPLISRRIEFRSTVCSDTWKSYTGVAANGYVHRW